MASQNDPMNKLQQAIDEIDTVMKNVNKAAENTQDVKDGKCTAEEERMEPGFVLFNQISKSVLETLREPEMMNAFVSIGEKLGEDVSCTLVNIVAICCATSAHNAVCFYDELLKGELTKSFDACVKEINACKADTAGCMSALKVFRKRLEAVEQPSKIAQAMKDAGIPIKEGKI